MSKGQLPESWASTEMENLLEEFGRGKGPKYSEKLTDCFSVNQRCIYWDEFKQQNRRNVSRDWFQGVSERLRLKKGDILVNSTGTGTLGRAVCVPTNLENSVPDSHVTLMRAKEKVNPKFILSFLRSKDGQAAIQRATTGSTNQIELNKKKLGEARIPIPPCEEQKRIVSKIESINAKVNTIEVSISRAEGLVEKFRDSLLQKAFRGELVQELPNDEPACELIKKIRSNRAKNAQGKKNLKDEVSIVGQREIPMEIPKSWEWVSFDELIEKLKRGPSKAVNKDKKGIRYLTSGNIQNNKIEFDIEVKHLKDYSDHLDAILEDGDLIISCVNSKAKLGKSGIFRNAPERCMVGFNNYAVRFASDIDVEYMNLFCNSSLFKSQVDKYAKDAINQSSFAGKDLHKFLVPIPPARVQKEIAKLYLAQTNSIQSITSLFARTSNIIMDLRSKVFDSAVSGTLVPRVSSEGTGHSLLEELMAVSVSCGKQSAEKRKKAKQ